MIDPPQKPPRPHRRPAHGYTLIELVVALGISSILLVAVGSSILLASYAIPQPEDAHTRTARAASAIEQLSTDLHFARQIITRQPHELVLAVEDRTGDGSVHRIRYAFSGTPGDPLTRQIDEQDPTPILDDVAALDLTYHLKQREHTYRGSREPASNQTLSSNNSLINLYAFAVDPDDWAGQLMRRSFDDDVVGWRITHAHVRARLNSTSAPSPYARLRPVTLNDHPDGQIFSEASAGISSGFLGSFTWNQINFSEQPVLRPGQTVAFTIEQLAGSDSSVSLAYERFGSIRPGGGMLVTESAGSSWTHYRRRALRHFIQGHMILEQSPQAASQKHLNRIDINLKLNDADAPPLRTAVHPASPLPLFDERFELNFRQDPTAIDRTASGEPDWRVVSGTSFNTSDLSDGIWQAQQRLQTRTAHPFTGQTRLNLSFRHTRTDTDGGAFAMLRVHRSDGRVAPLLLRLVRESGNRPTLELYNAPDPDTEPALLRIEQLPNEFIDVQLLVSAQNRTVNLQLDGIDMGTFDYQRITDDAPAGLTIGALRDDGHAAFQSLRLEAAPEP